MNKLKWILVFGIIVTVGLGLLLFLPGLQFMSRIPEPHSIPLDKEVATKLVMELDKFGTIYELDDCQRHHKSINGIPIRINPKENKEEYGSYFKDVLKEQKINELDFEKFRKALEQTKLRSYIRTENCSVFIVDGFIDGVWGYLYSHDTSKVEKDYFYVDGYTLRTIENMGDNWYRIAGS